MLCLLATAKSSLLHWTNNFTIVPFSRPQCWQSATHF